jgi:methylaspartate mutase epsilon subunit
MKSKNGHTILLGGIGGDSHSVGLTILRQALITHGYKVHYLGTQNRIEDFFEWASLCNVVMISSMDGHSHYYLRQFPKMIKEYNAYGPLWYLGGNLHIGDGVGCEHEFIEMGFDRVFVKFVDVMTVLQTLDRDLSDKEPVAEAPNLWERTSQFLLRWSTDVDDQKLDWEQIARARPGVLEAWKTGAQAKDLEENADFLSRQPSFPKIQAQVNSGRQSTLIQPRSGVPLLEMQIKLFQAFKSSGVRVLSYQVDSLTRNNNYAGAAEAIRESRSNGISTINGFPVINHGVSGLRQVIRQVKAPLQTRHSTRDPRLLAEICYAGGVTSFEGGAICYNIPYYKNYPLDESIKNWQYVDRLTGFYYERFGITLDREFFGTLTATLIPPSIAIVVNIIEALLAVRQGVKSVSLGYAEQGHRIQDIAAIRALRMMATEILQNMGYKDVQVNTIFCQYMAAFPENQQRAVDLIYNSAITARLSGATRVISKTPAEAFRIPSLDDNAYGISIVTQGFSDAVNHPVDEDRVFQECEIIRKEAQAIFESVIYCGRGDLAKGVVSGFQKGLLDIPFAPSRYNRGEVMTARDVEGAVRFLSTGNLQFDRELRQFNQEKMADRRRADGLSSGKQSYLLIENDVLRVPRCQYDQWPLFG